MRKTLSLILPLDLFQMTYDVEMFGGGSSFALGLPPILFFLEAASIHQRERVSSPFYSQHPLDTSRGPRIPQQQRRPGDVAQKRRDPRNSTCGTVPLDPKQHGSTGRPGAPFPEEASQPARKKMHSGKKQATRPRNGGTKRRHDGTKRRSWQRRWSVGGGSEQSEGMSEQGEYPTLSRYQSHRQQK